MWKRHQTRARSTKYAISAILVALLKNYCNFEEKMAAILNPKENFDFRFVFLESKSCGSKDKTSGQ